MRSLDEIVDYPVDGLFAAARFVALFVLTFGLKILSLPECFTGHLIDDLDVDHQVQHSLRARGPAVRCVEPDGNVGLVAVNCAAHQGARLAFRRLAETEPVVDPDAKSLSELTLQLRSGGLILERNDCDRPYV